MTKPNHIVLTTTFDHTTSTTCHTTTTTPRRPHATDHVDVRHATSISIRTCQHCHVNAHYVNRPCTPTMPVDEDRPRHPHRRRQRPHRRRRRPCRRRWATSPSSSMTTTPVPSTSTTTGHVTHVVDARPCHLRRR